MVTGLGATGVRDDFFERVAGRQNEQARPDPLLRALTACNRERRVADTPQSTSV